MSSRVATLKRLAEQLQGNSKARADACNRLAEAYWSGDGVEKDEGEAVKWWIKASDLGHAVAQFNLGISYEHGTGVAQNHKNAFHWYQKAADQGHAMAQCSIGSCYKDGMGVAQSYEKAFEWFQKAADQGNANAQYNLGNHYHDGWGVEQSYNKAFHWFQKAADQGDASAQFNLAVCYYQGRGVAKSLKKAKRLFKLAAKQGHAPAHAALAQLEAESGKDSDIRKTQKHLNKARAALAAGGSEVSADDKRVVQVLCEHAKLASLFRCHNVECSVAYSEDVSVQSAELKSCARCRKVAYCSVECQTADWKARHKAECSK